MTTAVSECIKCQAVLDESNWPKAARDNWVHKCGDCLSREKTLWARTWRKGHPLEARERSRRHKTNLRLFHPMRARARDAYNDCRKRALAQGMEFDLTSKFILSLLRTQTVCPYLGTNLTYAIGGKDKTLASIDRIDSSKGYTQDNVQVVSYLANLMKSHATPEELFQFAMGVMRMNGDKTQGTANGH